MLSRNHALLWYENGKFYLQVSFFAFAFIYNSRHYAVTLICKKKILWQASKFKMVFLMTGDFHLLLDQRMWQKGPIMWGFIHRRQNIFWVGKLGIFVSWSNETKHIGWIVRISVGHYCLLIRNFDCLNTDRKKQTPYTRLGIHTIRYLTSFTSLQQHIWQ